MALVTLIISIKAQIDDFELSDFYESDDKDFYTEEELDLRE